MTQNLSQLEHNDAFIARHIGSSAEQQQQMLAAIGASSLKTLIQQIVPADIQLPSPPPVGDAATEHQALAELKGIASQNQCYKSYIGMGYSPVLTPPVILRNMLENPGWYTAYTPYQPEVSQGRLEALLNFQQLTQDLTGLDLASASLLDEATAAAESMALAKRASKLKEANRFFVADDVHPQTLDVVLTRAETFGFEVIIDRAERVLELDGVFGVLLQQVGTTGELHDYSALLAELKKRKIMTSVAADIMALVLLTAPGKQGADVVFGSAQRLVCRWATVARMPPSLPAVTNLNARCRAGLSAYRVMRRATLRCAWRCKLVSNIFAAKKRTPTSVLLRCYWPISPACMRFIMARKVCSVSLGVFIA